MTKRTTKAPPPSSARLFEESHAATPAGVHVANIDGASRGNPGPAAYAVVFRAPDGSKLCEFAKTIGRETNNVAEYYGLIAALDYAASHGIRALRIRSDSELLVRQMQGRYKVKNAALKPLHERAKKLARVLDYFVIEHVMREQNSDADALGNLALDRGGSVGNSSPSGASLGAAARTATPAVARTPENSAVTRTVRATYKDGMFIPAEKIELPDGATLELKFRIPKKP
ncbi:MAG TPA: ribonuclease HI family protein [Candidatus Acidoferrales bacterium]|nr:ribonuclease HI family protein [Candidatus Acidoferrales bacterium]